MSDVIVAVVDGLNVRSYFRGDNGAMSQVAQFVAAVEVDPARLAAVVADLGDTFGWSMGATIPRRAPDRRIPPAAVGALPNGTRRTLPPIDEDVPRVVDYVRAHPGCTRQDLVPYLYPNEEPTGAVKQRIVQRVRRAKDLGLVRVVVQSAGSIPDRLYPVEAGDARAPH